MTTNKYGFLASLGIPVDIMTNQTQFILLVRRGMPGELVKRAVQMLNNRELFARILGTTSNNISRFYRVKKMNRKNSEKILDTIRLYDQVTQVFGDLEKAIEWTTTPEPTLSGEKPEALFDTFEGRRWVSQVLRKIEYSELA